MSAKSVVEGENIDLGVGNGKVQPNKSVPANMFGDFIEEQLQRAKSKAEDFDADASQVVCHAY
ncbi:hypothetical protein ACIPUD_39560 [Bradyrhizobium sp. CAR08]